MMMTDGTIQGLREKYLCMDLRNRQEVYKGVPGTI